MRNLLLLLVSLLSLSTLAQSNTTNQSGYVEGQVYTSETDEPIFFATIRLFNQKDTTYVKGTSTDENGNFKLLTPFKDYFIEISSIGYTTYKDTLSINSKNPKIQLAKIQLSEGGVMLKEAVVEAVAPDIRVKGDTIEYRAASYLQDENSLLKDLVRNIPGIEIDEHNNITANGKPIVKIMINNKEFFGNDIAMALTNLPANMIQSLQIFKDESELAKLTGFKDKNPDQVLNLVVKEELKHSIFGDARGGYGNHDTYSGRAMVSYMKDIDQASFVGNINNVNNTDYPSYGTGLEKNENVGFNFYRQSSSKFKVGGSIRYSSNENDVQTVSNTETFLATGNRNSKNESSNKSGRDNIGVSGQVSWDIDSLTAINFMTYIYYDKSDSKTESTNLSYVNKQDTTRGEGENWSKNDGYYINNSLNIRRKLNSKGRSITLSGQQSYRNTDGRGTTNSLTRYSDGTPNKVIDHISKSDTRNNTYSVGVTYVEPFGKEHSLQVAYRFGKNDSKRLQDSRKKDIWGNYSILDSLYSRNTFSDYTNHSINIDFQGHKEKYNYNLGLSLEPSRSTSSITVGDSIIEDLKQSVFDFSPTINFTYTPNASTNIDFSYYGRSAQPSVRELSKDTIEVNAMLKQYGNPDLKQSFDNNFNIGFMKSDYESNRFLSLNLSLYYAINKTVNYSEIDNKGNSINSYRNVTGDMNSSLSVNYNTPFRNKKFTFTTYSMVGYTKNLGFVNGEKGATRNTSLMQQLTLKFASKPFENTLKGDIAHNIAKNSISNVENRSTTRFVLSNTMLVRLPYNISVRSSLFYTRYYGYGEDFKNSEVMWNASIQKEFLKKKQAALMLQFYDILKDRSNVSRQVTSSYISDYRTNSLSRYMMLTFSYRFNIVKAAKTASS